jgi:hypothetical protein
MQLAEAVYTLPEPHTEYTRIAFDQEHSAMTLPTSVMTSSPDASYQTFYVWTQRLGYVPQFSPSFEDAMANASTNGSVVVLIDPYRAFDQAQLEAIEQYVAQGGRLLVLATPREGAAFPNYANQVLAPFELRLEPRDITGGAVYNVEGDVVGQLPVSGGVSGGTPLLTVEGGIPVLSTTTHGDGLVAAASFSQPFSDREMGTTSVIPNSYQRFLFEMEYWLFRSLVEGEFSPLQVPGLQSP